MVLYLPSPFGEIFCPLFVIYICYWVYLLHTEPGRESVPSKKRREAYLHFGYLISTLHAIVVGGYATWILFLTDMADACVIYGYYDWTINHIMIAYLLADLVCVAIWISPTTICIHHLVSSIGLVLAIRYQKGYGLCVRFALTELSTIPLNLCWYLQKQNASRLKIALAGVMLIITYFLVRIVPIVELVRYCLPEIFDHFPPRIAVIGSLMVSYTALMNCYWFILIIRKFYLAIRGKTDEGNKKSV